MKESLAHSLVFRPERMSLHARLRYGNGPPVITLIWSSIRFVIFAAFNPAKFENMKKT